MRGKFIFAVGLATGYVLGTRAGRRRYEQIKTQAQRVWNTPVVQKGVGAAEDFASARIDQVKDRAGDAAKKALGALLGSEPKTQPSQSVGSTRPSRPAASSSGSSSSSSSSSSKPRSSGSSSARKPSSSAKKPPAGGDTPPVEPLTPSTDI